MQCPIDGEQLLMTTRNGVEIDYCPKCRGVWLDRGELDKIIEASGASQPYREDRREERRDDRREERYRDDDRDYDKRYKKRKRSSFLSEIFDFD